MLQQVTNTIRSLFFNMLFQFDKSFVLNSPSEIVVAIFSIHYVEALHCSCRDQFSYYSPGSNSYIEDAVIFRDVVNQAAQSWVYYPRRLYRPIRSLLKV